MSNQEKNSKKTLGIISLAMINVAAVLSLRNFPTMAVEGWTSIFWYLLFTICFLIPISLVGAELASTWPEHGGIYAWIKRAFGDKNGFIAIWCGWVNNLVWFPTVLSFFAATLAYTILAPALQNNSVFMAVAMLSIFWIVTGFNFFGTRASSLLSSVGTLLGAIIPSVLLMGMMGVWIVQGKNIQIPAFTFDAFLPGLNIQSMIFAASMILMFAGMEMAGYHATETRNPAKDFPLAMFLSAGIICIISIIATLAVAFVVPVSKLNLNSGITETFALMFQEFNIGWAIIPVGFLLVVGIIAQLSTWLIGPAKGLLPAAMNGDLPPFFRKMNNHGIPTGVLIVQAVISSVFALIMVLFPSMNEGYWVMTAITTLVNCIMYLFLFAAVIQLRKTYPDTPRPFKLPGGTPGLWIIAGIGFLSVFFAFLVGFLPPDSAGFSGDITTIYVIGMIVAVFCIVFLPAIVFNRIKKPSWTPGAEELKILMDEE
ncbi:amino acid permease [Methanospirillum stamsii]|uniref:Amino acid permease n=1 Tax=Methanospirillum stamsii TaxID=1277351 RepID=A0A2V2N8Y6_9EURY|nr:amino acid permease [Methanospirillum stamsii]PWR72968.1 amino acid permease [Methanospirillum stamsii]